MKTIFCLAVVALVVACVTALCTEHKCNHDCHQKNHGTTGSCKTHNECFCSDGTHIHYHKRLAHECDKNHPCPTASSTCRHGFTCTDEFKCQCNHNN